MYTTQAALQSVGASTKEGPRSTKQATKLVPISLRAKKKKIQAEQVSLYLAGLSIVNER